jgi:hypothetical protein
MSTPYTSQITPPRQGVIDYCDECEQQHPAYYSHEGRFGEGPIYAVVCTVDDLTDYYTTERVTFP